MAGLPPGITVLTFASLAHVWLVCPLAYLYWRVPPRTCVAGLPPLYTSTIHSHCTLTLYTYMIHLHLHDTLTWLICHFEFQTPSVRVFCWDNFAVLGCSLLGFRREFDIILPWGVLYLISKSKLSFLYLIKLINIIRNIINSVRNGCSEHSLIFLSQRFRILHRPAV